MNNKFLIVFDFLLMLTGCLPDEERILLFDPDGSCKRVVTFKTEVGMFG